MVARLVIIAFEPIHPVLIHRLGLVMAIWLVDSGGMQSINRKLAEEVQRTMLTWFSMKESESPTDALIRIIFAVDQHHDESSQQPAYDSLWVIGKVEKDRALSELAKLDFIACDEVLGGMLFLKKPSVKH